MNSQEIVKGLNPITIGVCARNEERNITECLSSLSKAIKKLPSNIQYEFFVCLNGCTDRTEGILTDFINHHQNTKMKKIVSEEGVVQAQRMITRKASPKTQAFFFFDADIWIEPSCLYELWKALSENPKIFVVYASAIPTRQGKNTLIGYLASLYDTKSDLLTERYYFHGRAFGIRKWAIPSCEEIRTSRRDILNQYDNNFLQLRKGIITDDIFLSRQVIYDYGVSAIKLCPPAQVYFTPLSNLKDLYRSYRRVQLELERLDILFPEHRFVQKKYFNRKTDWHKFRSKSFSIKVEWLTYLFIMAILRQFFKIERLVYGKLGFQRKFKQWEVTTSTKGQVNNPIYSRF